MNLYEEIEREAHERDVYEEAFYALVEKIAHLSPDGKFDPSEILIEARKKVEEEDARFEEEFARGMDEAKYHMEMGL